eukprot:5650841-Amphidinium_carterae.1
MVARAVMLGILWVPMNMMGHRYDAQLRASERLTQHHGSEPHYVKEHQWLKSNHKSPRKRQRPAKITSNV